MGIISVFLMIVFAIVISAIALSSDKRNKTRSENKIK